VLFEGVTSTPEAAIDNTTLCVAIVVGGVYCVVVNKLSLPPTGTVTGALVPIKAPPSTVAVN